MHNRITKIVITGGPCAGKSTALGHVKEHFEKLGYAVVLVPEAATELINAGLTPTNCGGSLNFQLNLLKLQIQKERIFAQTALTLSADKILMICDRGKLDSKAYLTDDEFASVTEEVGISEVELRDDYDAVFHLVTVAKSEKALYNTSSNMARTETAEQAIAIDDRLISVWTGHPHLRIIDNSTDFEEKLRRLDKEIAVFLGEPQPLEIERKFLIEYPDIKALESNPFCKRVDIVQTYLVNEDGTEVRIRQRGADGGYIYFKTIKKFITPTKRIEIEERLTREQYDELLNACNEKARIAKSRYCLVYANLYFEIDVYPFWNDRAVMEIELNDENQEIVFPEQIDIIKEVTDDRRYLNSSLARNHNLQAEPAHIQQEPSSAI